MKTVILTRGWWGGRAPKETFIPSVILNDPWYKDPDALPAKAREAVENGLARDAIYGFGDMMRLQGRPGFRLRIGQYRVIFGEDETTILAIYIGRRTTTTYRR